MVRLTNLLQMSKIVLAGKDILLLNPRAEDIQDLVRKGATVTAVSDDWHAAKDIQHATTAATIYMPTAGYLRGVLPGQYDHILAWATPQFPAITDVMCQVRRALRFGGQAVIACGTEIHYVHKPPGWLILSYPRCGTHMLLTALSRHPALHCYGEVFNPGSQHGGHAFAETRQVLEGFWLAANYGFAAHAYIGRKPPSHTPFTPPRNLYTDFWSQLPRGIKVIMLKRRNLLRRHISHLKARKSGTWNSYGAEKPSPTARVTVKVAEVLRDADYVEQCWAAAATVYPAAHVVYYEDLCDAWGDQIASVQDYLGVTRRTLAPTSNKLARAIKYDVTGYEQLCRTLRDVDRSEWID